MLCDHAKRFSSPHWLDTLSGFDGLNHKKLFLIKKKIPELWPQIQVPGGGEGHGQSPVFKEKVMPGIPGVP